MEVSCDERLVANHAFIASPPQQRRRRREEIQQLWNLLYWHRFYNEAILCIHTHSRQPTPAP
ncbi:hypothetical protein AINA4_14390 [Aurantimicrobium sp. INA4]|nr:hypothetical protein AINA4_14390 [Aurantimicrobium sp. INA4]